MRLHTRRANRQRQSPASRAVSRSGGAPSRVAGLPSGSGLQGQSLLARASAPRVIYSESFPNPDWDDVTPRFRRVETAVYSGENKLIYSDGRAYELFNLASDPLERRNVYTPTGVGEQLAAAATRWRRVNAAHGGSRKLDANALQRLKSLGYVQ